MYVLHSGGHVLLSMDNVWTVMILDTGNYTLKVAQSAVTKCWHMYPTILWRTGLLLTWSLLCEAVILQCDLMFQCLPVSEMYKNGIPHYIHCQDIPITSWHPSQIMGRLVGTMTFFLQKIRLYTGHLGVTSKDISRSGIIHLFNPKLLSWQFVEGGVRLLHLSPTCTSSASVVSSLKKQSCCGCTVTFCYNWFVNGGLWGYTFRDFVQPPLLFLLQGMTWWFVPVDCKGDGFVGLPKQHVV